MLTDRRRIPEFMDDPDVDPAELERAMRFIRAVNRRLGGTRAALAVLKRWSAGRPPGEPVRILDVGTGSADIPLAIARWAASTGRRVHITAIDRHQTAIAIARTLLRETDPIELVEADALRLMELYEPGSFSYAHAGMFLHHLDDVEVVTVLRIMERLASRGVIWNDLVRGPIEAAFIRALTIGQGRIVRQDAIASVAAGFTKREALDLAGRAGLDRVRYRRHLFGRFVLTGETGARFA